MKLTIDPEFRGLLPPLSADEKANLEALIVKSGMTEKLVSWQGILIDGHNRLEICERLKIKYAVRELDLPDREAVMDWIDANQLGRRNLKPNDFKLAIGRRYERTKKPPGGREGRELGEDKMSTPSTAEKLAKEHCVDARTVRRAGAFVNALATLGLEDEAKKGNLNRMDKKVIEAAKNAIPELAEMCRVGEIDFKTCAAVAKLPKDDQKKATLGGVFGVKQSAKGKPKQDDKPAEAKPGKVPDYRPTIGKEIAALGRHTMDRVLDQDEHFEWAMENMITYCKNRKQNRKQ